MADTRMGHSPFGGSCMRARARNTRPADRGAVMLLALVAVAIGFVVGLTFLALSTTAVDDANVMSHHAQSRQIAESGLGAVLRYVSDSPGWRATQPQGEWIHELAWLGGTLSVTAEFAPEISSASIAPNDASFETQTATLATPLLGPPMSGAIGGWQVVRTALVQTGPTVPGIGTQATAHATAGANAGFVSFSAAVTGSGTFSQTLGSELQPATRYELAVDITVSTGLANLSHEIRVLAGGAVVASSATAWTLTLPQAPGNLPTPPQTLPDPTNYESVLTYLGVPAATPTTFTLAFVTDNHPPAGTMSIELYAQATGLAATVWFDNVRLTARRNDPLTLEATGKCGEASHVVRAHVIGRFDGSTRVVDWEEP